MGYFYPNGLSSKSGAHSLLRGPIYTSARALYVDSENGSNSNPGSYSLPKETLDGAGATARIVVLKDGHDETIASGISLAACTVVGEAVSGGTPSSSLTMDASNDSMLSSNNAGQQFINVAFGPQETTNSSAVFDVDGGGGWRFSQCTFATSSRDGASYVDFSDSPHSCMEGCLFGSAASSASETTDFSAVFADSQALGLRLSDCSFDVGAYGSGESFGVAFLNLDGTPGARLESMSMLRGATAIVDSGVYASGKTTQGSVVSFDSTPQVFTGGLSEPSDSSDAYLAADTLMSSSDVLFVDGDVGDDSNDGGFAEPFATLAAAVDSLSSAGAMIVVRSGHRETLSDTLTIDQDYVLIVAEDDVEVSLGSSFVSVTGDGAEIRNITFATGAPLSVFGFGFSVSGAGLRLLGCSFVVGHDTINTFMNVVDAGDFLRVEDCTFSVEDGADVNSLVVLNNTVEAPLFRDVTFTGQCETASLFGRATLFRGEGMVLRDGASVSLDSSSTGYLQVDADPSCPVEVF